MYHLVKLDICISYDPATPFLDKHNSKGMWALKDMSKNVQNTIIENGPMLEATHMFINSKMDNCIVYMMEYSLVMRMNRLLSHTQHG